MSNNQNQSKQSCVRGLLRYQLGEDFSMWKQKVYQEMVEKNLHIYFPHDDLSNALTENAEKMLADIKAKRTDTEKADTFHQAV